MRVTALRSLAVSLLLAVPFEARTELEGTGLAAGLAAIRAERIRADVEFFADDSLRGRDTPSPGLRVAARFLRARLERLGLEPGGDGDWFHDYAIHRKRIDPARSGIYLEDASEPLLRIGEDYFVSSYRQIAGLELEGGVRFGGGGERDELEALNLGDGPAWVVCEEREASWQRMARNAERAGALGLIVVPGPQGYAERDRERLERTTGTATRGTVSVSEPSTSRSVFPTLFLTREATDRLLAAARRRRGEVESRERLPASGADLGLVLREERLGSGRVKVENVAALWLGDDPELRDEVIVLSAHYDHVGAMDEVVWNGADDNASGSMALLAVAEGLVAHGPLRRSVLVLWVSGEEKGLWGSAAWTRRPVLPEGARAVCNINLDMVGRNGPGELHVTPSSRHAAYNGLTRLAEELAPEEGFPELGNADEFWSRSDHANFHEHLGLPVTFLHAGEHADYHEPSDTADKVDADKIARVARLVLRMIVALQDDTLAL